MKKFFSFAAFTLLMTMTAFSLAACSSDDDDDKGGKLEGMENGHAWVDLGLPSGTKWATCNIGAEKPEDYGSYFAWGETAPKSEYTQENYKWGTEDDEITKYCLDWREGKNSFVDHVGTLELKDDAARANWDGDWRMPTDADFKELVDNTVSEWTNDYKGTGVKGRLFTANNGKSIFLPAAGYCYSTALNSSGSQGGYWSSSLYEEKSYHAKYLDFNSGGAGINKCGRYYGQTVRPVR